MQPIPAVLPTLYVTLTQPTTGQVQYAKIIMIASVACVFPVPAKIVLYAAEITPGEHVMLMEMGATLSSVAVAEVKIIRLKWPTTQSLVVTTASTTKMKKEWISIRILSVLRSWKMSDCSARWDSLEQHNPQLTDLRNLENKK